MDHYNTVRLHSAIGFITPADMLAGGERLRSMRHEIASWKRRGHSGRISANVRVTDEVYYLRVADHPGVTADHMRPARSELGNPRSICCVNYCTGGVCL